MGAPGTCTGSREAAAAVEAANAKASTHRPGAHDEDEARQQLETETYDPSDDPKRRPGMPDSDKVGS